MKQKINKEYFLSTQTWILHRFYKYVTPVECHRKNTHKKTMLYIYINCLFS